MQQFFKHAQVFREANGETSLYEPDVHPSCACMSDREAGIVLRLARQFRIQASPPAAGAVPLEPFATPVRHTRPNPPLFLGLSGLCCYNQHGGRTKSTPDYV